MNFWIIAIALLAIPAVIISWPLITGPARDKMTGVFIILMTPLAGVLAYQYIGTPEAIGLVAATPASSPQQQQAHSSQQGQMDELVASLQQRLLENPDDPEGWLILGRSLKTMQRYTEAETSFKNANRLVPNDPRIMIELAESSLFASGEAQISPEIRQLLESALAIDPDQQKGLWLIGMAAAQDGDEAAAITFWQRLLDQLDPASGAAGSVNQQIEMARTRLGGADPLATAEEPDASAPLVTKKAAREPVVAEPAVEGFNIPVTITISDDLSGSIPANAVLFVFMHPAGAVGMPLAVKRLSPRGFPMSLNFSDADLLNPGGSLQDFEQLDISARISMKGIANAATGDYQADRVTLDTKNVRGIALDLDQRVP